MNDLGARLAKVVTLDPAAVAISFEDQSITWGELSAASDAVEAALRAAGVTHDAPIGWGARNQPGAVAAFLALVVHRRMVVPLRPNFAVANFRDDLLAQKLQAVIAGPADWAGEGVIEAAREVGTVGIEVSGPPLAVRVVPGLAKLGAGPFREPMPGYVLERLTSGTTGAPKRLPVRQEVLIPSLQSGEQSSRTQSGTPELALKRSPALLFKPFSHAGGLFGLLLALYQARPIILFERFDVERWVAAVARYKPKTASLVPAMIRMLLDAEVDPHALSSLMAVRSGTAALEPAVQEAFEQRFGVPILVDYGAAEFIGGLAGWTLADHRQFGATKRGSVGRARGDVAIRAVDAETGASLPANAQGLVEVRSDRYGGDWIRTNDLAQIDADGFIFLRGRADDAINRGGFKVLPEDVSAVLREHPAVEDAAVIAKPDARLGQVPIAAVELKEGAPTLTGDELGSFLREKLPAYMIPVEYRFMTLPRTVSHKVARAELKRHLGL